MKSNKSVKDIEEFVWQELLSAVKCCPDSSDINARTCSDATIYGLIGVLNYIFGDYGYLSYWSYSPNTNDKQFACFDTMEGECLKIIDDWSINEDAFKKVCNFRNVDFDKIMGGSLNES